VTEVSGQRPSTKPYLIRAIFEWCGDSGYTPYLAVKVDPLTRVPAAYVKNGEIILNIGAEAVKDLHIGNDYISCGGRFGGVAHDILVPVGAVIGIFARENGEGMAFEAQDTPPPAAPDGGNEPSPPPGKPQLRVVK
jgi:stringent starvation protein B